MLEEVALREGVEKMKIGELSMRSGLSAHTIRYYEKIGLLPFAERDLSGRRDYDISILIWIEFLGRLKMTSMPLSEIRRYALLREKGPQTGSARRRMLEAHRDQVRRRLADLQLSLGSLDQKIAAYAAAEEEDTKR
jgi:DNA-binding transcriptional MerR regulator